MYFLFCLLNGYLFRLIFFQYFKWYKKEVCSQSFGNPSLANSLWFEIRFISLVKESWKCHNYFSLWKHTRRSRSWKEFSWLTIECTFEKDRGENTEILSCRKRKKPSWWLCVAKRWAFVNQVNTHYKGNVLWFPLGRIVQTFRHSSGSSGRTNDTLSASVES